jgi:uncharacterized phage protein gp47/JayE
MSWFKSQAETFHGVSRAIVIPRYSGRGTVGILILGTGGVVADSLLVQLSNYFNSDDIDPAGAYYVIPFKAQYFYQDYTIKVFYDPAVGAPSDSELNAAISAYYSTLSPGDKQVLSVIKAYILQAGMKDVDIISPTENVTVPDYKLSALGNITWQKEAWNG